MATVMQKIKDVEDEAKLAKLRRELLEPSSKGGGGGGQGFDVTKSGDARVGLVGFPSVEKSTLLNKLTGTFSEGSDIQLGTVMGTVPLVLGYQYSKDKRLIEKELEGFGIRKKDKGGINFVSTVTNTHLDLETVKVICSEYRIHNADITLKYDATADDLIDVIEGSRIYMPCIYAANKIDQITLEELEILDKLPHYCPISAQLEWNLDGLLEKIWEYLDLTRIYTKPKGMNPDYEDPVILSSKRRTVKDFCNRIHKDMVKQLKYCIQDNKRCRLIYCLHMSSSFLVYLLVLLFIMNNLWHMIRCSGMGIKRETQASRLGKEHELEDEDDVQIIKKV
ncbi:hypothetical protein P3X46_012880 [Hevea brasiliensis]|uniref:OBG-type G domain-containing protein n=1 Tax=Hevea brasiliensis TaxID=3981 RepID=A0ABQ9MBR3_HEVBR|nr:hypothetical protein P3X46_012880 [Hevea brasiliensis]